MNERPASQVDLGGSWVLSEHMHDCMPPDVRRDRAGRATPVCLSFDDEWGLDVDELDDCSSGFYVPPKVMRALIDAHTAYLSRKNGGV